MKSIDRRKLVAEQLIREHVRKRIKLKLQEAKLKENKIRKLVRTLIEAETGTEEPSDFTGINVLAALLEKIIPVIEDDYKMLTSSEEQRESFRNHIIHAVKNSLRPIESATDAENIPEGFEFEVDANMLAEKMKIDLDPENPDEESVEGEFIDIDAGVEEDSFGSGLNDQNETGRNFAAETFKKVEKQIVDSFDMLADEEDQNLFYDYLLTNLLLYFDKFEDELQPQLPDTTTPEYEKEKDEETAGEDAASEAEDLDSEEGEEAAGEEDIEI